MNQIQCTMPTGKILAQCRPLQMGVTCAISDESVDIWLHGIIGDEYTETDSLSVARVLAENRGKQVNLRVNSPGGIYFDGLAIYNAIDAHDGYTVGIIEGLAGSAASLALIACDHVQCYSSALFHPHYALLLTMGHQADLREALSLLEKIDSELDRVYSEASGLSVEQVQSILLGPHGDGTAMGADEALAAGFVDEIVKHNKSKLANPAAAAEASKSTALAARCVALLELELDRQVRSL